MVTVRVRVGVGSVGGAVLYEGGDGKVGGVGGGARCGGGGKEWMGYVLLGEGGWRLGRRGEKRSDVIEGGLWVVAWGDRGGAGVRGGCSVLLGFVCEVVERCGVVDFVLVGYSCKGGCGVLVRDCFGGTTLRRLPLELLREGGVGWGLGLFEGLGRLLGQLPREAVGSNLWLVISRARWLLTSFCFISEIMVKRLAEHIFSDDRLHVRPPIKFL
ncbi:hypothetical protein Tco_0024781 [Tanacetum coccineum]